MGAWYIPKPENGVYVLYLGPEFHPKTKITQAYCDIDGGGWTVNIKTFLICRSIVAQLMSSILILPVYSLVVYAFVMMSDDVNTAAPCGSEIDVFK